MIKKKVLKKISFLLIGLIIFIFPSSIFAEESKTDYDINYFMEIMELIQQNYVYDISDEELIEGAIRGLFYNLDQHSQYYSQDELNELLEFTSGDFVGIGVYITIVEENIEIVESIEGSPAYKMGLRTGDIILEVDGESVEGLTLDEVSKLIKGEEGTCVKLKIKRGENIIVYNITREVVQINPIKYSIIDDDIAYIKITEFNEHTSQELEKALKKIDKENIVNVIIDLRNNPGGLLIEAAKALEFFVPEGPLVHIRYKDDSEYTLYSNLKNPSYNLVVLVNENSASASEIFAGAVQDRKAGKIIGTTSYGKGTVQMIFSLPYGDGIKLTIAEYLTPNRRNINNAGIIPDIVVENTSTEDLQLKKAVEYFNTLNSRG